MAVWSVTAQDTGCNNMAFDSDDRLAWEQN